jgi:hypothetical protein
MQMTGMETRSDLRDSLFLLANIRIEHDSETHRVRVRNLSDGGMMAEGNLRVQRGHRLQIELRNIGVIAGNVAWVQDNRFGIVFDEEVDSQRARLPPEPNEDVEPLSWAHRAPLPPDPVVLRKI